MPELVVVGCRCLVGVVFVIAVAGKVCHRATFEEFVDSVRALAPSWRGRGHLIAFGVVAAEAVVPVLLAVPFTARIGAGLACIVVLGFSAAIAAALWRGSRASCRCFGASTVSLGWRHLVRNGLLFVAAVVAAVEYRGPLDVSGVMLAVAVGVVAAVFVAVFDELVELFSPVSAQGGSGR